MRGKQPSGGDSGRLVGARLSDGGRVHAAQVILISRDGAPALPDLLIFQEKVEMQVFILKSSN